MSEHRILRLKPALRLERRGQHGQNKPDQRDHRANLADSSLDKAGRRIVDRPQCHPGPVADNVAVDVGGRPERRTWARSSEIAGSQIANPDRVRARPDPGVAIESWCQL